MTPSTPAAPVTGLSSDTGGTPLLNGNLSIWSGILQPGAQGLNMLIGFADVVLFSVFDEAVPSAKKGEGYLVLPALVIELLHPLIVQGSGALVVFSVCNHMLQLSTGQKGGQIHGAQKGGHHDTLVLGGDVQKNGQTFVGPPLIFCRDVEGHMVPTIQPVPGQTLPDAVCPFGQKEKMEVGALSDHIPYLIPPRVGLLQEEVTGHTHPEGFSASNFIVAMAVFFERKVKAGFHLVDVSAKFISLAVLIKHVAVVTALTKLVTPMPRVPNIPAHSSAPSFR